MAAILAKLETFPGRSRRGYPRPVRIGVDTYSFHRMLGFLRPHEQPSSRALADGGPAAVELAVSLGADVVAVQTCFLPTVGAVDAGALLAAAGGRGVVLSWGAPDGLAYGTDPAALADAEHWVEVAAALGTDVMRIVLGGPRLRDLEPMDVRRPRVVPQLAALAGQAQRRGLRLAIENHGEIAAADLRRIVDEVGHPALGVCFDTANAVRVGDDPVAAARLLADRTWMLHLKDVEPPDRMPGAEAGPRSVPYGEGVVPLAGVLDALAGPIAAGAPVCVELGQIADGTDEVVLVADGIAWLRGKAG
jgi:sugar phosphate isomerase/epimerase